MTPDVVSHQDARSVQGHRSHVHGANFPSRSVPPRPSLLSSTPDAFLPAADETGSLQGAQYPRRGLGIQMVAYKHVDTPTTHIYARAPAMTLHTSLYARLWRCSDDQMRFTSIHVYRYACRYACPYTCLYTRPYTRLSISLHRSIHMPVHVYTQTYRGSTPPNACSSTRSRQAALLPASSKSGPASSSSPELAPDRPLYMADRRTSCSPCPCHSRVFCRPHHYL